MKIESAFELSDKVIIKDHGIRGVINSIWVNKALSSVVQYEVEWKDKNDILNYRYFGEKELKKIK